MSWRTTTLGIASIITAIAGAVTAAVDGNVATNPDWAAVIAAVTAGIGLINARDHKVSSEQAGAGK
jgi:hypothetical protein